LARRAKWSQGIPEREFFGAIRQQLSHQQRAKVVILGGASGPILAGILRDEYQRLRIIVLDPQATASDTHIVLCRSNPYHFIIDVSEGSAAMQIGRFRTSFMHLRRDGSYLVRRVVSADNSTGQGLVAGLDLAGVLRLAAETRFDPTSTEEVRDLANLGASIASVERAGEGLLVQNQRRARPILRDHELNPILDARPEIGQVIESRNGGAFGSRCDYHDSREFFESPDETFTDPARLPVFDVPPLHLRRYLQPTCTRGQIVESHGLLMPDTYRHHRSRRLVNQYVKSVAPHFGEVMPSVRDPVSLEGAFFHFDSEWPGHFGHTISEQISRLWAYDRAKKLEPELKLLTTLPPSRPNQDLQAWEIALLGTHGIEADDVVVFDRAVRPARLYAATPMFSCPEYVHPDIIETWDRIGRSLHAQALPTPSAKRIFCSRRTQNKRACRNSSDVESFFAQHGFLVVYPEDHSMAEQVAMFRAADVVAGFAGSGLFTMAFCETPKTIIVITPQAYTARNEYLFASVRGHRLRVVWSRPDIVHPPGSWTPQAFASSFAFDFDCEGIYLRQLLADLDD
jgi:capsular polysaccharide biosynthesis protein